jgi:hypothetical protein
MATPYIAPIDPPPPISSKTQGQALTPREYGTKLIAYRKSFVIVADLIENNTKLKMSTHRES